MHENLTINIGHRADSAKFIDYYINIAFRGLIGGRFKMPNAPYCHPLTNNGMNTDY